MEELSFPSMGFDPADSVLVTVWGHVLEFTRSTDPRARIVTVLHQRPGDVPLIMGRFAMPEPHENLCAQAQRLGELEAERIPRGLSPHSPR